MKKNLWPLALVLLAGLLVTVLLSVSPADSAKPDDSALKDSTIQITEICAKNESIIPDNDGKYRDYVELYNSGAPVSLKGYTFYDGKIKSAPIGDIVLETGEYRVFFISRGQTGFALGASGGDTIQLLNQAGKPVAQTNTAALNTDEVMLYVNGTYKNSYEASPGFANDSAGRNLFLKGTAVEALPLAISEVLLRNVSAMPDENGAYSDMVELWNRTENPIDLNSYFLSDDPEDRFAYRLPQSVLEPGSYIVLCCDGQNYIAENGLIHTNFGLAHGETLILTAHTGEYIALPVTYAGDDTSLLLDQTGSYAPGSPSLGYENTADGVNAMEQSRTNGESPLRITEVLLSAAGVPYGGAFCDVVEITNVSDATVSTEGWFLSDGGDPYEYPLPVSALAPTESVVITCGPTTTGFSLSDGETIRLTGPDYRYAPLLVCADPEYGKSIVLVGSDVESGYAFMDVTLGYANEIGNHQRFLEAQAVADLRISEVMSGNRSYLKGAYATTCDWIELYNASDKAINLADYSLTDNKGNLHKYVLPDQVVEAGEYCIILLSDDPVNLPKNYPVIGMTLASDGDTVYLSKGSQVVDYLLLPEVPLDMAYGRQPGSVLYSLLKSPTPGRENSAQVEITAAPVAMTAQGCYDGVEYVDVVLSGEGDIYYTTNCYAPTVNSARYTEPIRLTETTVLRVMCRQEGKLQSEIVDLTYLINENDHLPVVTIVTAPNNLWDNNTGIYVTGPNPGDEVPYRGANYWMDWEKSASVSLFETDGSGFSEKCGIKIFGGYSRMFAKKSLTCFFRAVYGASELKYPLFGEDGLDTYESFVLRSSGQDLYSARMRDVVNTSLMADYTDVPVQDYRPVIVYLNGEYWGLHYIREKLNEHYLAGHYNTEAEDMTMVKLLAWDCPEYRELLDYTASHDMRVQEYYDYVCSKIDVDNYIDFFAAQMWICNTDNGNVRYFISPEGKWTWILYDTDISLMDSSKDRVEYNLGAWNMGSGDIISRTFAVKLMDNPEFRDKFLRRLAWQMNTIWTEEVFIGRVDEIAAMIDGDMPKETARWGSTYEKWLGYVEELRQFARERSGYMLEHIQKHFRLTDEQMREYGFNV